MIQKSCEFIMKKYLYCILFIILLIVMLLFPEDASEYAKEGLLLWFRNMIPALFPFMVLQALAIRLNVLDILTKFTHPVIKCLGFSKTADYGILTGFLCGFPMGAISVKELYQANAISRKEANYLLAFCNNIGPVFFCTIVAPMFPDTYRIPLFLCMYGIPVLYGCILGNFFYKKAQSNSILIATDNNQNNSVLPAFRESIHTSIRSMVYLGGCMVFFNMLRIFPALLLKENNILQYFTTASLEINGALAILSELKANLGNESILLFLCMLHFGGLSCIIQTAGILSDTDLSVGKYVLHKMIQTLLWLLLAGFFIMLRFFVS